MLKNSPKAKQLPISRILLMRPLFIGASEANNFLHANWNKDHYEATGKMIQFESKQNSLICVAANKAVSIR